MADNTTDNIDLATTVDTPETIVEQPISENNTSTQLEGSSINSSTSDDAVEAEYTTEAPVGDTSGGKAFSIRDVKQVHEDPFGTPNTSVATGQPKQGTQDWFLTRVTDPYVSTKDLFDVFGVEGFADFRTKEVYWSDKRVRDKFENEYGSYAKEYFDKAYENSKQEFSAFQLGTFQRSQTGYELARDNVSDLRSSIVMRFDNLPGTMKIGRDWTAPTRDYREVPTEIKFKTIDSDGREIYESKEYTPELLKELEKDPSFGGLAYSDAFYNIDPNTPVNGLYFNAVYDGMVLDELTGTKKDVRNDQVVSRWDIDTGPTSMMGLFQVDLGTILKNNKLEADSVADYAKILVKAPLNTAVNVLDTGIQLTRAVVAGSIGITNIFKSEAIDVRENEAYKFLTTKGVALKGYNTSMTREALTDGFFFSLEASLTTIADIATQVALAGALGRAGAGASAIINGNLEGEALNHAKNRAAEVFVRSTLTALAVKDSYNEALENGYSTSEASVIAGAMTFAMWHATKYASYIFGSYETKVLRENIRASVNNELGGLLKTLFRNVADDATVAAGKVGEERSKYALSRIQEAVSNVFGKVTKQLPASRMAYVAREEAFEEMTEELFQDGVKQVASAYGKLINNAHEAGKGRYLTIFDEGYFLDALERYASSGIGGAFGGPLGMIGNKAKLEPITSSSSLVDIMLAGKKSELISVMDEMKVSGAFGPKNLSTEYVEALKMFEPIVEGKTQESLAEMVYGLYRKDIEVVDTFINKGMFGLAAGKLNESEPLRDFVNKNGMRQDYVKLMGNLLDFHSKTGVSMDIHLELDKLPENKFSEKLPVILKEGTEKYAQMRAEIDSIKEEISSVKSSKGKKAKAEEKPKIEEKEPKQDIPDEEENSILNKELSVPTINDSDIISMYKNYQSVRAIATGAASEYYLMQNELAENTMLGAKQFRLSKYADLGEEPLKDMLIAMRVRSLADEKIHAQTLLASEEAEATLVDIKEINSETIAEIEILLNEKASLLTEKALNSIVSLFKTADFSLAEEAFDVNNINSIFPKEGGQAVEASVLSLYKEIVALEDHNLDQTVVDGQDVITIEQALDYFKLLSKDIKKAGLPIYDIDYELGGSSHYIGNNSFLQAIVKSKISPENAGLNRILDAVSRAGIENIQLLKAAIRSATLIKTGMAFKPDAFKRKNIRSLFKRAVTGGLTQNDLVDDGLSVVREMLDSSYEGIYTMTDHSELDDVLNQIEIREEVAKVLGRFVTRGDTTVTKHYANLLYDFRKNIIDLIDIKYKTGSVRDTSLEQHAYKDYTVLSDFFVDFLFDPMELHEIQKTDPLLHTIHDKGIIPDMEQAAALLHPTYVAFKNARRLIPEEVTPDSIVVSANVYDDEQLSAYLEEEYKDDFKSLLEDLQEDTFILPYKVFAGYADTEDADTKIAVVLEGISKLKIGTWLFKKSREVIVTVADKATAPPYIEAKKRDNAEVFGFYTKLAKEGITGLEGKIYEEVPEFQILLEKDPSALTSVEMGRVNIAVEKALYRIYNNSPELVTTIEPHDHADLVEALEDYVSGLNVTYYNKFLSVSVIEKSAQHMKELSVIIGALTTDFSDYYSKFKAYVKNMDDDADIVVAGQEHAAKYAGAYIYSPKFRELADTMSHNRQHYTPNTPFISAVYVMGKAGAGKSSAVIKLGTKIAIEILEKKGYTNTAVLPVSNYDNQVDIIEKSVGAFSKGEKGMNVAALQELLTKAVVEEDEEAIARVKRLGIIAMDEITYVQAVIRNNPSASTLEIIAGLIKEFNLKHNADNNGIVLLFLGDPKQSGVHEVTDNGLSDASINLKRVHSLSYMDFSFRSRNNFLVDSLATVATSIENSRNTGFTISTNFKLEKGTRYGTLNGKYYGLQVIDAVDKTSNATLYETLNNQVLADNIEANILKTIAANASKTGGEKKESFSVLLSIKDLITFDETPSKIGDLSRKPEYKSFFTIVPEAHVGGSEANYVIAEVNIPETEDSSISKIPILSKKINTISTRPIDFGIVINKDPSFLIPEVNASVNEGDGKVKIPDSTLEGGARGVLRNNYLEILQDIKEEESTEEGPEEEPVEEDSFEDPPLDDPAIIAKNLLDRLNSFLTPNTGILTYLGAEKIFSNLKGENLDFMIDYMSNLGALNNSDDKQDLISTLDRLWVEGKKLEVDISLPTGVYNSLLDLQSVIIEASSVTPNVHKAIIKANLNVVYNYLEQLKAANDAAANVTVTPPPAPQAPPSGTTAPGGKSAPNEPIFEPLTMQEISEYIAYVNDIIDKNEGVYSKLLASAINYSDNPSEDARDEFGLHVESFIDEKGTDFKERLIATPGLGKQLVALITAKAEAIKARDAVKLEPIDIVSSEKELTMFSDQMHATPVKTLKALLKQLDPANTGPKNLPSYLSDLFLLYTSDSIYAKLRDIVQGAISNKKSNAGDSTLDTNAVADSMAELTLLIDKVFEGKISKDKVGREAAIISEEAFTDKALQKASAIEIPALLERAKDIRRMKTLFVQVYGKPADGKFGDTGSGTGIIKRNVNTTQTLSDYQRSEDKLGNVYTIGISKFVRNFIPAEAPSSKLDISQFMYATSKQAEALFNYDKGVSDASKRNSPTEGGIRITFNESAKGTKVNIFPYVTVKGDLGDIDGTTFRNTNVIISQLSPLTDNYTANALFSKFTDLMVKLKAERSTVLQTTTNSSGTQFYYLDVPIKASIKDVFYTRPGSVLTQEGFEKYLASSYFRDEDVAIMPEIFSKGETVITTNPDTGKEEAVTGSNVYKELSHKTIKEKVNISNTLYVVTKKEVSEDIDSGKGNLRGEIMAIYSMNNSIDIDSNEIKKKVLSGQGLEEDGRYKFNEGTLDSEIGVTRLMFKPPLDKLAALMRKYDEIKMQSFVSDFSIALQQSVVGMTSSYRVGQRIEYRTATGLKSFVFTTEAMEYFNRMNENLNTYFAKNPARKEEVLEVLRKMRSSESSSHLDMISLASIIDVVVVDPEGLKKAVPLLYKSEKVGAEDAPYIFNLSKALKNFSATTLASLNILTDIAKLPLRPAIQKGTTTYFGVLPSKIVEHLSEYLISPMIGIRVGDFKISEQGISAINVGTELLTAKKVEPVETPTMTSEQAIILERLDTFAESNEPLEDLYEYLDSIQLTDVSNIVTEVTNVISQHKNLPGGAVFVSRLHNDVANIKEYIRNRTLKENGSLNNSYLSDYAQSTPSDSEFRKVLAMILNDFKGTTPEITEEQRALGLSVLKELGADSDGAVASDLWFRLDDGEMKDFIGNIC